ncbi:hypothetical protein D3C87_377620 [compost metagenome]
MSSLIPLKPFASTADTQLLQVSANALRKEQGRWLIEFQIEGDLSTMKWPETFAIVESRKDDLWKHTCLEAFFAETLDPESPYVEMNCSPSGDWNIYVFSGYRQNLTPLSSCKVTLVEREGVEKGVHFTISVDGLPPTSRLHIGLTAVIEHANGNVSHWALAHPGIKADFHDKHGFLLEL